MCVCVCVCVCTYLTGLSHTGCGHCSELSGLRSEGKKRTKWSEEEWKELREVVGLPTETAFIQVKPTDSWFLWRQHNTVIKRRCSPQKSKLLNGDYESNMEESKKKSIDRDLRSLPCCVPHAHWPEYVWFCMYYTVKRETEEVSETAETKVDIQSISE